MHQKVDQNLQTEISDLFEEVTGVEPSSVTSSGDTNENVLIRSTSIDSEKREAVIEKMTETYGLAAVSYTHLDVYKRQVYEKESSGGGGGTHQNYTLRYETNGGEAIQSETHGYSWTKQYEELPVPVRDGYTFDGWYLDSQLTVPVEDDVKVNHSTITLYASWCKDISDPDITGVSDWLNTSDHNAYLDG